MSAHVKIPRPLKMLSAVLTFTKKSILSKAYPTREFPDYEIFIQKIRRQKERSIYASASELYYAAFFGRDAIEAAEDLLIKDSSFARELIPLLASHQGTQYNLITEEEPGRIHHEYRMSPQTYYEVTGEKLPKKVAEIYYNLASLWGGTDKEMTYYGSVDATPLYVKLVTNYIEYTKDKGILDEIYIDKDGRKKIIYESLLDAMEWLTKRIEKGPREDMLNMSKPQQPQKRLPLLEYRKNTEQGISNQSWKDSITSVLHENGTIANTFYPIATIELQGHAYDALVQAANVLIGEKYRLTHYWKSLADRMQDIVCRFFWLHERKYFAMAIDRNEKGLYRKVTTLTSDQTELLNTKIFDNIDPSKKNMYISGIIQHIYNENFLTDVGIRSRSLSHDNLVNFWDYHGSRTVWIKATYDFIKGLEVRGFYKLAEQLKYRVLNGIRITGSYVELFYVAPNGRVAYEPLGKKKKKIHEEISATTIPEDMQTWTASAVAAIEYGLTLPQDRGEKPFWKTALEDELMRKNPQVALITSPRKAYKAFPKKYSYTINIERGKKSEEDFKKRHHVY